MDSRQLNKMLEELNKRVSSLVRDKKFLLIISLIVMAPLAYFVIVPQVADDDGFDPEPFLRVSMTKSVYNQNDDIYASLTAIEMGGTLLYLDGTLVLTKMSDYSGYRYDINKAGLSERSYTLRLDGIDGDTGRDVSSSVTFTYSILPDEPIPEPMVTISKPVSAEYITGEVLQCVYTYSNYVGAPTVYINGNLDDSYISGFTLMSSSYLNPNLIEGENTLEVKLSSYASDQVTFRILPKDGAVKVDINEPIDGKAYNAHTPPETITVKWTSASLIGESLIGGNIIIYTDYEELLSFPLTYLDSSFTWKVSTYFEDDWEGFFFIKVEIRDDLGHKGTDIITIYFEKKVDFASGFEFIILTFSLISLVIIHRRQRAGSERGELCG